ncbi:hypothetical protein CGRA01v4_01883 [Colletotrichum graminicola]|nr:hypothetical protein CGRA01v4_01883 [Colletotrichum graminicola]
MFRLNRVGFEIRPSRTISPSPKLRGECSDGSSRPGCRWAASLSSGYSTGPIQHRETMHNRGCTYAVPLQERESLWQKPLLLQSG